MEGLPARHLPAELMDRIGFFPGARQRVPIPAPPGRGDEPAIWLLGSSGYSAQLAGVLGLPFSFAHHFSSANTIPALALYRQSFRPSRWLQKPLAMVAVAPLCADTHQHAPRPGGPAAPSLLHPRARR